MRGRSGQCEPADGGRRRLAELVGCIAVVVLVLAGCGDDDGDGGSDGGGQGLPPSTTEAQETTTARERTEPEASPGCEGDPPRAGVVEEERTLTIDGTDRRYLLTVPSGHGGEVPLPVVFDFHGLMEGAAIHAGMSQYSALAEEEGFVVVFPHGTGEPVRWTIDAGAGPNPDLTYFDAVLEEVSSTTCIDESRVYATGLSNGAMFTSVLLCQRADVLAAAAPVAGILHEDGCEPSEPVPVVTFHGTEDPILLFNGGVNASAIPGFEQPDAPTTTAAPVDLDGDGYPANVAAFAEDNGCDPEPEDAELTDEVIHRVYDCPAGADVEFYIVVGGGHSWPSSEFSRTIADVVGMTTFDVDATSDAWEFMSRFTNG